ASPRISTLSLHDALPIFTSDTLVENPGVKAGILALRDALAQALPWVEYHIVEPREDQTLMVCIIGKGYQSPSVTFKYCVRRLKRSEEHTSELQSRENLVC